MRRRGAECAQLSPSIEAIEGQGNMTIYNSTAATLMSQAYYTHGDGGPSPAPLPPPPPTSQETQLMHCLRDLMIEAGRPAWTPAHRAQAAGLGLKNVGDGDGNGDGDGGGSKWTKRRGPDGNGGGSKWTK